jgi:hypothetical protein
MVYLLLGVVIGFIGGLLVGLLYRTDITAIAARFEGLLHSGISAIRSLETTIRDAFSKHTAATISAANTTTATAVSSQPVEASNGAALNANSVTPVAAAQSINSNAPKL